MGSCVGRMRRVLLCGRCCCRRREDSQYLPIIPGGTPLTSVSIKVRDDTEDEDTGGGTTTMTTTILDEEEEAALADVTLFVQLLARDPNARNLPLPVSQLVGVMRANGPAKHVSGILNDTINGTVNMLIRTGTLSARAWATPEGKSRTAQALGGRYVVTAVEPTMREDVAVALDDHNKRYPKGSVRDRSGSVGFV